MRFLKSRLVKLLPFLLVIAVILLFIVFQRAGVGQVQGIICKTQYGPCLQSEEEKLEQWRGQSLPFLSSRQIKEEFSQDFRIKDVYVQRVFPGSLQVFLERRKPIIGLRVDLPEEGVFLVDADGVVLEFTRESGLPLIRLSDKGGIVVGQKVSEPVLQASQILYLIFKLQLQSQDLSGTLTGSEFTVSLGDVDALFTTKNDPRVLVGALQVILARSRIEGKQPKVIDLRYRNPVLRY